jgi:1-acyl-sn-glycerol-3-phosphate acyltransferase
MVENSEVDAGRRPGDFTGKWDPAVIRRACAALRPIIKVWFRSEVRGLERIPRSGALVVANHSGGLFAMDIPVFIADFFEHFGYDRTFYTLLHDMFFKGPQAELLVRSGMIRADRRNAVRALRSGATVLVFPGGDYDVYRPTMSANVIDFGNRTGYVTTAVEAGVPIVPAVSIGGQENQLYLTRGQWLARRLGLKRRLRIDALPLTVGVPFGFSVLFLPLNWPLPTKIVTEVLDPIDITAQFGNDPDVEEVDFYVRGVMQQALNKLAAQRRLPVIG